MKLERKHAENAKNFTSFEISTKLALAKLKLANSLIESQNLVERHLSLALIYQSVSWKVFKNGEKIFLF